MTVLSFVQNPSFVQCPDEFHSATAGVFAQVADPAHTPSVSIERGAIIWPGEIALAPDAMHAAFMQAGTWVPG